MSEPIRTWRRPMRSRDTAEEHRVSTPLELFFDLCFVVAVSQASAQLHHFLTEGKTGHGVLGFLLAFFAVYWAWLNFTWFASAYDTDDDLYRLTTLLQMAGVLVLAAGIPKAFDFKVTVVVIGYVIMRVAQVGQWVRAALDDPEGRRAALRYAVGVAAVQVLWVARLPLTGTAGKVSFAIVLVLDLAVPAWAEHGRRTSWHPEHIAERYGLFTLIVLGESVLAATTAVQAGFDAGGAFGEVLKVAIGGLLTVFAMWWLYYDQPTEEKLTRASTTGDYRPTFLWGYGHYLVFGSAAAVGAGLEVAVDAALGKAHLSQWSAGMAFSIPVAVYVLVLWALHIGVGPASLLSRGVYPLAALLVLAAPVGGGPVVLIVGLIMAGLVAVTQITAVREAAFTP